MFLSHGDQVEHAHDNPLDEITLGESSVMAASTAEMSPEMPASPKKMDLVIDRDPEMKCEVENAAQSEAKRTKKKDAEKEKDKRKNMESRTFTQMCCAFCNHAHVC